MILLSFAYAACPYRNGNLVVPMTLTWEVISQTRDIIWNISKVAPPYTWWPPLLPDACALFANWDFAEEIPETASREKVYYQKRTLYQGVVRRGQHVADSPGCSSMSKQRKLSATPFYVCPRKNWEKEGCGGVENFFCKVWGCETSGTTSWNPSSSWDFIKVSKASKGSLNTLNITFTNQGILQKEQWLKEKQWGLRYQVSGGKDPGFTFSIRLRVQDPPSRAARKEPSVRNSPSRRETQAQLPSTTKSLPTGKIAATATIGPPPSIEKRLFDPVEGAFLALNRTNPTSTKSCWLCYTAPPPYYEGIAQNRTYYVTEDYTKCNWEENRKVTLEDIIGEGLCLGQVPLKMQHLCVKTLSQGITSSNNRYLVPPPDTVWACNTGITPCISTAVFNEVADHCILIQLVPRLLYHDSDSFLDEFSEKKLWKREPVTITLAVLLGLGMAAGIGTGAAALIQMPHYYDELKSAINTDISVVEQSITNLEESLTSLSEVVMQNRRGLDVLFMKEGGLCVALKEECCFYVDHSGVIKDSMAKLRERLDRRRRERESRQGWYENWFDRSPWFATLISTLVGPLVILFLLITFGPCILNKLVAFVKERINTIQVMVLRQQYLALQSNESQL